jgi:CelD/BcsL family acetyltransferase involved in cellulose biosynthesis
MGWELKPAREAFSSFATEWDRLNGALYNSHPMFDSRFIGPLIEHFGKGDEQLCLHRTDGLINGALILRPLGLGRWALFLPAQAQAGAIMLNETSLLETLFPALPGHAWSLDLLAIDSSYAPDWSGLTLPRIVHPHALTMAVTTAGDFAAYWQARPKKLRDNLRRYRRRAEVSVAPLSIQMIDTPDEIIDALTRYGQLESAGWKGREGSAIAPDNIQGRFYAEILRQFSRAGQAHVMELRAGEQVVASRLFIRHEQMWVALKTTYDETQSAFAPGRLLLLEMLERAFTEIPGGQVEFYTNADRDQAEWANALRPIPHHQIFRNDLIGFLFGMINILRRPSGKNMDTDSFAPLTVQSYSNIDTLPPAALKLFEIAETHYPEFSANWFTNLQRTVFSNDSGVRYYVAKRADDIVAILPVRLTRQGSARQIKALSNYYTSLYSPLLAPAATELDLAALLQAASRDHGGAHEIRFAPMDPAARTYAATLTALRSIGWVPFRFFCFGNWHLMEPGNWAGYLKGRSASLRSNIKRALKNFHIEGGQLIVTNGSEDIERNIQDFINVYSKSWKRPEPFPDFIPGLMRWLANNGQLRLGIALLQGKPIAAQLWIVSHNRAYIFKVAYDETFQDFSPGTLVTSALMEYVTESDAVIKVDFLIGDDDYKKKWMSKRTERWGMIAYNLQKGIGLALLAREIISRFRKAIVTMYSDTRKP